MGTHVLLEAAKIRKIQRFIHVSTDEVYGEIINGVSFFILPVILLLAPFFFLTFVATFSQIAPKIQFCHLPTRTQQPKLLLKCW